MSKTAMISARIEPKLKNEAETVFRKVGLNTAQAITLFFTYVKNFRGLPFQVRIPNRTTRRAIENARRGKNVKYFASVDEMIQDLDR